MIRRIRKLIWEPFSRSCHSLHLSMKYTINREEGVFPFRERQFAMTLTNHLILLNSFRNLRLLMIFTSFTKFVSGKRLSRPQVLALQLQHGWPNSRAPLAAPDGSPGRYYHGLIIWLGTFKPPRVLRKKSSDPSHNHFWPGVVTLQRIISLGFSCRVLLHLFSLPWLPYSSCFILILARQMYVVVSFPFAVNVCR